MCYQKHIILKYNEFHKLILLNKDISVHIIWEFLHCSNLTIVLITLVVMDVSYCMCYITHNKPSLT